MKRKQFSMQTSTIITVLQKILNKKPLNISLLSSFRFLLKNIHTEANDPHLTIVIFIFTRFEC